MWIKQLPLDADFDELLNGRHQAFRSGFPVAGLPSKDDGGGTSVTAGIGRDCGMTLSSSLMATVTSDGSN